MTTSTKARAVAPGSLRQLDDHLIELVGSGRAGDVSMPNDDLAQLCRARTDARERQSRPRVSVSQRARERQLELRYTELMLQGLTTVIESQVSTASHKTSHLIRNDRGDLTAACHEAILSRLLDTFDPERGSLAGYVSSQLGHHLDTVLAAHRTASSGRKNHSSVLNQIRLVLTRRYALKESEVTGEQLEQAYREVINDKRVERRRKGEDDEQVETWLRKNSYLAVEGQLWQLWQLYRSREISRDAFARPPEPAQPPGGEVPVDLTAENAFEALAGSPFSDRVNALVCGVRHDPQMLSGVLGEAKASGKVAAANDMRRRVAAPQLQWVWLTDISSQLEGTW